MTDFFEWLEVEELKIEPIAPIDDSGLKFESNNSNLPEKVSPKIRLNSTVAQKLYDLAVAMEKTIEEKLHPALERLNPTRRRANMIASSKEDGYRLQAVQNVLYALADAHEDQTIPQILSGLTTRVAVEILTRMAGISRSSEYCDRDIQSFWDYQNKYCDSDRTRLTKSGINGADATKQAIGALKGLMGNKVINHAPDPIEQKIQELEYQVKFDRRIAGFFPTPKEVAEQLIQLAQITPNCSILEPSAGKGDICTALLNFGVNSHQIEVCEVNYQLIEILKLKGFNLVTNDCLNLTKKYDRIIGNPPFENGQDVEHIRYLYDNCLNDGGILTMITSTSWTFSSHKKFIEFRGWFSQLNGQHFTVAEKAFLKSDVPTAVNTAIVKLIK